METKTIELLHYKNVIVSVLNRMMYDNGWSIKQLSEKAGLPYESVKKLIGGKINNPTIYTLIKLSNAFGCSLDCFIENECIYGTYTKNLPQRAITLLSEIVNFETYLLEYNKNHSTNYITSMVPTGILSDGMIFDGISTDLVDISAYQKDFGDIIMCGIKIVGKSLHPTYLNGDILLVGRDRFPLNGEVGIFLIEHRIYIRKYIFDKYLQLEPISENSNTIVIKNVDDVHFFGRVITIVRK